MLKTEAQTSIKNLQIESSKLETSALITLFELNLSNLLSSKYISTSPNEKVFYFHNNTKLITTNIRLNNKTYLLCPITASGFEVTSQGVLPTPTLNISSSPHGIPALSLLKEKINLLGDLIGATVIRRRTFAKFLPRNNFNSYNIPSVLEVDELAEFPPDVWYVSRKSKEDKLSIEYELSSIFDVENIELPQRLMLAKRCSFTYRGEGCLYEYNKYRVDDIHGDISLLPESAPPVATEDDKLITDILGISVITDLGEYNSEATYNLGDAVYLQKDGVKYFFVAKSNNIISSPPDPHYWIPDKCSKCLTGCKIRWSNTNPIGAVKVSVGMTKGHLPFGGFISLDKIQ